MSDIKKLTTEELLTELRERFKDNPVMSRILEEQQEYLKAGPLSDTGHTKHTDHSRHRDYRVIV